MTGQEVWEAWKENPDIEFKGSTKGTKIILKCGDVYWKKSDELVSVAFFMLTDWESVEKWKKVDVMEAMAYLALGGVVKSQRDGNVYVYPKGYLIDEGGVGVTIAELLYFDWYIKEK